MTRTSRLRQNSVALHNSAHALRRALDQRQTLPTVRRTKGTAG